MTSVVPKQVSIVESTVIERFFSERGKGEAKDTKTSLRYREGILYGNEWPIAAYLYALRLGVDEDVFKKAFNAKARESIVLVSGKSETEGTDLLRQSVLGVQSKTVRAVDLFPFPLPPELYLSDDWVLLATERWLSLFKEHIKAAYKDRVQDWSHLNGYQEKIELLKPLVHDELTREDIERTFERYKVLRTERALRKLDQNSSIT